ncbi:MAG: glutathione transport system ATP-binding protein [Chloroflexota bacterium]|jgi:oligopeptide/dipeptide ABC transporter ATP-binding protein|nr:glutathione transport system ATP-binding protein [Chloroflexota bacterium]
MTVPTAVPATVHASGAAPLLDIRGLTVEFATRHGAVHAVNSVSFTMDRGETLALVGESGSGKSVTSLAVNGLLPKGTKVGGEARFSGQDVLAATERDRERLRGRHIAMIFQDPQSSLNPVLRIDEQIGETIRAHETVTADEVRKRTLALLAQVGIPRPAEVMRAFPHQLSGGMRQRVMIAIAMALEPELLIADEPTTALDATIQAQILELLLAMTADRGTAMLLITHDMGVVARSSGRVAVMYAGHIVETATTRDLFAHPRHPYTDGLLRSTPRIDRPIEQLRPIQGSPPDPSKLAAGCPFAPRCPRRLPVCDSVMPPLEPVAAAAATGPSSAPEHLVACHNPIPVPAA